MSALALGLETASLQLKLLVRFVVDPLMWESMKAAHRHAALMNPSPGRVFVHFTPPPLFPAQLTSLNHPACRLLTASHP